MGKIFYISGGAKSGKSIFAENIAFSSQREKIYIATALLFDEEMKQRAMQHQQQRGSNWITIEAYKDLPALLEPYTNSHAIVLLDCLTNLVMNMMFFYSDDWKNISSQKILEITYKIEKEIHALLDFIYSVDMDLIIVSNELGMGLVPAYPLGRHFRDIAGRMNQIVAQKADSASFIVSGLELKLK